MGLDVQNLKFLVCLIFSLTWLACIAYEGGICDEPQNSMFCTCDTRSLEIKLTCYITNNISKHDEVWGLIGDVENAVGLKLNSMLPFRLNFIPTDSFQHMDSLKTLSIKEGNLGVLEMHTFSNMKELRELILDGSEITELQPKAITNLPKLKKLSLSENLLQEVLAETLTGLSDLEQLFLDRNNISRVETCAFCDLHNLKELELWGNQITDLTEYMFRGLRYLRRLDLYKNQIRILNDKIFHSMGKLVEIDLKDNLISHVFPNAFQGLEKLQILMLNSNKIKMLPDQVFKPLPSLRSVDMYNNELETLQAELVENMANSKDEHFSFSFKENPIMCDCRLQWVKSFIKMAKSHQFSRELRDFQCKPYGENETLQTVHLMKMECDNFTPMKQKNLITTSRSVTQPVNLVPYEIHGRKNKTRKMAVVTEDVSAVQDSEVDDEKEDSEAEELADEKEETEAEELADEKEDSEAVELEKSNRKSNRSSTLSGDIPLVTFVTIWTLFLVRKRKGT